LVFKNSDRISFLVLGSNVLGFRGREIILKLIYGLKMRPSSQAPPFHIILETIINTSLTE
jgi:hypothetical protein